MNMKKTIGDAGENFVAEYLKNKGFIISARNYHSRFGELDIIAENNEIILFVEVKTRALGSLALPKEFVDKNKRAKIIATAQYYISNNGVDLQPRFDVAEVTPTASGVRLNYIENAFGVDEI